MTLDPRTPVLVGAGQVVHRAAGLDDALDPAHLMADAIRLAFADAGVGVPSIVDSIRVVGLLSWRYGNPAHVVAGLLGVDARQLALTPNGGNSPQSLVNLTAQEMLAGQLDIAVLTGGEAWRTRMRARKAGIELDWPKAPEDSTPEMLGADLVMNHPDELARQIMMPVQVYPMFESAIRASLGRDVDEHSVAISELWARFSAVAATNPYAWLREPLTAEQIRTPGPSNRMVGLPYPKYMNSNNDVDMGAAVVMCTVERARQPGIAADRGVFPHSGSDCHEHPFVSHRWSFHETPAIRLGGRLALELAGVGVDDLALIDLYSCFPAAVQLGAASLGIDLARDITLTGGLSFAGGPWNNYVMHSIATMMGALRAQPGETGLVWANGGYTTKHAFGVYSTEPPKAGFRHAHPQAEIDAMPRRELALPVDAAGRTTIESYTVMHGRDGGPETALCTAVLPDSRRAWGTSSDADTVAAMCIGEWVGHEVTLDPDGTIRL